MEEEEEREREKEKEGKEEEREREREKEKEGKEKSKRHLRSLHNTLLLKTQKNDQCVCVLYINFVTVTRR